MTIQGGSGVVHPGAVASMLGDLKLPQESDPVQALVTQALGPAPAPELALKPNELMLPESRIPNVSQAHIDSQRVSSIELPSFEDEPAIDSSSPELAQDKPVDDDPEIPSEASVENWKKFRESVKAERKAKREIEAKLLETSSKLEKYEKGETVPDIIRAKDERIAQLEPYEKIVSLKLSPEYQENFVAPAIELRGELEKLGEDYGLPAQLMHQAVGITNRKELNGFLSRHGFDDVGALEVKRVIGDLQDLGERALEADKEPAEALQSLKAQYIQRQEQEKQTRAGEFEYVAKEAWNSALEKTKNEGVYKELILHPTDSQWNKTVVEPIQQKAATQFGLLVKQLSANGLKTLPPALAMGLARTIQLGIAGTMALDAKANAENERNTLIQNSRRTNGYMRPQIGGSNGSAHNTHATPPAGPTTPKDAAETAAKFFNK